MRLPASISRLTPPATSSPISSRKRTVSSTTPRKTLPAPRSPAATAPWSDSGAPVWVSRAASTVGVSPWSASETSTASKSRVSSGEGGRRWTIRNVSSVSVVSPISSPDRSRPMTVMLSASEVPTEVRELRRHAHHRRLHDVRVRGERLLDLGGGHVLAAPADDLLLAAEERVRAVVVLAHEVAGLQPAVRPEHALGLLRHAPVALH